MTFLELKFVDVKILVLKIKFCVVVSQHFLSITKQEPIVSALVYFLKHYVVVTITFLLGQFPLLL